MARKLQNRNEPKVAAMKASETINREYTERRLVSVGVSIIFDFMFLSSYFLTHKLFI